MRRKTFFLKQTLRAFSLPELLVVLGRFLSFYRLLRRRPPGKLFSADLGLGDTCMALALAPLFEPVAYVRLLLAAGFAIDRP